MTNVSRKLAGEPPDFEAKPLISKKSSRSEKAEAASNIGMQAVPAEKPLEHPADKVDALAQNEGMPKTTPTSPPEGARFERQASVRGRSDSQDHSSLSLLPLDERRRSSIEQIAFKAPKTSFLSFSGRLSQRAQRDAKKREQQHEANLEAAERQAFIGPEDLMGKTVALRPGYQIGLEETDAPHLATMRDVDLAPSHFDEELSVLDSQSHPYTWCDLTNSDTNIAWHSLYAKLSVIEKTLRDSNDYGLQVNKHAPLFNDERFQRVLADGAELFGTLGMRPNAGDAESIYKVMTSLAAQWERHVAGCQNAIARANENLKPGQEPYPMPEINPLPELKPDSTGLDPMTKAKMLQIRAGPLETHIKSSVLTKTGAKAREIQIKAEAEVRALEAQGRDLLKTAKTPAEIAGIRKLVTAQTHRIRSQALTEVQNYIGSAKHKDLYSMEHLENTVQAFKAKGRIPLDTVEDAERWKKFHAQMCVLELAPHDRVLDSLCNPADSENHYLLRLMLQDAVTFYRSQRHPEGYAIAQTFENVLKRLEAQLSTKLPPREEKVSALSKAQAKAKELTKAKTEAQAELAKAKKGWFKTKKRTENIKALENKVKLLSGQEVHALAEVAKLEKVTEEVARLSSQVLDGWSDVTKFDPGNTAHKTLLANSQEALTLIEDFIVDAESLKALLRFKNLLNATDETRQAFTVFKEAMLETLKAVPLDKLPEQEKLEMQKQMKSIAYQLHKLERAEYKENKEQFEKMTPQLRLAYLEFKHAELAANPARSESEQQTFEQVTENLAALRALNQAFESPNPSALMDTLLTFDTNTTGAATIDIPKDISAPKAKDMWKIKQEAAQTEVTQLLSLLASDIAIDRMMADPDSRKYFGSFNLHSFKSNMDTDLDSTFPNDVNFYLLGLYNLLSSEALQSVIENGSLDRLLSLLESRYSDDPTKSALIAEFRTLRVSIEEFALAKTNYEQSLIELTKAEDAETVDQGALERARAQSKQAFATLRRIKASEKFNAANKAVQEKLLPPQEIDLLYLPTPSKYTTFMKEGLEHQAKWGAMTGKGSVFENMNDPAVPEKVKKAYGLMSSAQILRIQRPPRWVMYGALIAEHDPRYANTHMLAGALSTYINEQRRFNEGVQTQAQAPAAAQKPSRFKRKGRKTV